PRDADGVTAALASRLAGLCALRQLVCFQSLAQILPSSALARGMCDQVQSEAGQPEARALAPGAPASAVSARASDRSRSTAPDLSGADPAREAYQAAVCGLCAHQQTAPSG